MEDFPTGEEMLSGTGIAEKPDRQKSNASLGRKLRFPGGQEAVTAPTHAFVKLANIKHRPLLRLAEWYARLKATVSRFAAVKRDPSMRQSASISPLGKEVWLGGTSQRVRVQTFCSSPSQKECH